ncbi:hypothetical protein K7432_004687 [Basidiobolus ranarum]|uniref:Uncharacterized protein n=1 Tax=Basidiobolus ranarum TaxID=34480 RepID=A0ABR2WXW4_9FUNG
MSPVSQKSDPPVMLWCHPRSVSSAFERAFIERKNEFHCFHEPFADPYYFGPDRVSDRHKEDLPSSTSSSLSEDTNNNSNENQPSFKNVSEMIMADYWIDPKTDEIINSEITEAQKLRVFVKDMAFYGILDSQGNSKERKPKLPLKQVVNTFLIRDPKKSVVSFYKASISESTGWGYFDPKEMGYKELRELFDYVTKELDQPAIVVDADDLCDNPAKVMETYCDSIGVRFVETMVEWKPSKVHQFSKWQGWYDTLQNSSGLGKVEKAPTADLSEFPDIVRNTIEQNLSHYNYLKQFCINT